MPKGADKKLREKLQRQQELIRRYADALRATRPTAQKLQRQQARVKPKP